MLLFSFHLQASDVGEMHFLFPAIVILVESILLYYFF